MIQLILSFLFAVSAHAAHKQLDLKELQYVKECEVWSYEGKLIYRFPGTMCLFLDDGRFVSADSNAISMYDKRQVRLWSIPGHFHHQLNWAIDKKSLFALSSDMIERKKGMRLRADSVLRIDLDGKIVARTNSENVEKAAGRAIWPAEVPVVWTFRPDIDKKSVETTHFNSVYEIPQNALSSKHRAFKAGNVIVNNAMGPVFILSPDLKRVLFTYTLPNAMLSHDVKVTKSGELLFFNNFNMQMLGPTAASEPFSSIDQVHPLTGAVSYKFVSKPKPFFFCPSGGAAQELDERRLLISTLFNGMFVVDRTTNDTVYHNYKIMGNGDSSSIRTTLQYYAADLRPFLKAWGLHD